MKISILALILAISIGSGDPISASSAASTACQTNPFVAPTSIEALTEPTTLSLQGGHSVELEPGIRFTTVGGACTFATYDGRKVEIEAGSDRLSLNSPVTAILSERGWEFNGSKPVKAGSITARRHQAQDDTDSNLKSMQEAAKKLKTKETQPARKLRIRWLYAENPFPTAELFDTPAIQQLSHLSPVGF